MPKYIKVKKNSSILSLKGTWQILESPHQNLLTTIPITLCQTGNWEMGPRELPGTKEARVVPWGSDERRAPERVVRQHLPLWFMSNFSSLTLRVAAISLLSSMMQEIKLNSELTQGRSFLFMQSFFMQWCCQDRSSSFSALRQARQCLFSCLSLFPKTKCLWNCTEHY